MNVISVLPHTGSVLRESYKFLETGEERLPKFSRTCVIAESRLSVNFSLVYVAEAAALGLVSGSD